MKPTHCKNCGHNHSGPCTECPDCRKAGAAGYSKNPEKTPPKNDAPNPTGFPEDELKALVDELESRVEALEKRLDAIDKRRKYQREYMRESRRKKRNENE